MKYMGSKARIANEILPIILKNRINEQRYYVEPFCGGCNTIDKVSGYRIASDSNKYLIAMWKGLQDGNKYPLEIKKELYSSARDAFNRKLDTFSDFEIGWIGWMGSYNGRFFDGGYSGHHVKVGKGYRDYISESIRNIIQQISNIRGIEYSCCTYDKLKIPENSIIYCDIPYKNTKQYGTSKDFNYNKFWQWCRDMSYRGHEVFISEYEAPEDFSCIWSKEIANSLNTNNTYRPVEKLFKYERYKNNKQ